jgi:GNAT superfamily N-acetyltransferase
MMTRKVVCQLEPHLDPASFRDVLIASGLGATRPVDDMTRIQEMLAGATLVVSARLDTAEGQLVGVARGLTDFSWCCYLTEVAVDRSWHVQGIGRALIAEVRSAIGERTSLVLASMPDAVGFYTQIGMEPMPDVFLWPRAR